MVIDNVFEGKTLFVVMGLIWKSTAHKEHKICSE